MKIFVVLKNRDTIEGAGPMLFDAAFDSMHKAMLHIAQKMNKPSLFLTDFKFYDAHSLSDGTSTYPTWSGNWLMHDIVEVEVQ